MKKIVLTGLILTVFCLPVIAARSKSISIQQRLANLENLVAQSTDNRSNSAELVLENQKLQQQIAELKGRIEEQDHQIQNLTEKQKLLYIDVDSRLTELESNPPVTPQDATLSDLPTNRGVNTQSSVEVDETYEDSNIATIAVDVLPQLSSDTDDYDIAFAHLRAGRFSESARAFEDFIQKYPQNDLTDNAYYWLGESYYVKRQYPQALAAFQSLTKQYPQSSKAPDSWLKIGYSYYEMDDLTQASENLQKVIDDYPNSSIARLAKNRLRQLQRDN